MLAVGAVGALAPSFFASLSCRLAVGRFAVAALGVLAVGALGLGRAALGILALVALGAVAVGGLGISLAFILATRSLICARPATA